MPIITTEEILDLNVRQWYESNKVSGFCSEDIVSDTTIYQWYKKYNIFDKINRYPQLEEYFRCGWRRFYKSMQMLSVFVRPGDKIFDIGGGPFFEDIVCSVLEDVEYDFISKHECDIRHQQLDIKSNSIDIVLSWETIEHLWVMDDGGMMQWTGILHFWDEAHRILKKKGSFFVTTVNRFCPRTFRTLHMMLSPQIAPGAISKDSVTNGHIRELSAFDLQQIVAFTQKFTNPQIGSFDSYSHMYDISYDSELFLSWINKFELFLDRDIRPGERYDTVTFIGQKL